MGSAAGTVRFVLARARAYRPLLAAALLTVLLTTAVLATLTAYSGTIGDAALRHALRDPRGAADTTLVVKADVPARERAAAGTAVRDGARAAFDGLPVTLRTLSRSGPYALPASVHPADGRADPGAGGEDPGAPAGDRGASDTSGLTHLAALDRTQVRVFAGRPPGASGGPVIETALPEAAARRLGLAPGARLTLTDRLGGPAVQVRITGLYRPVDATAPYWQLDDLHGRGVVEVDFTTYGPLLADPSVLSGDRVSAGTSAWLASAGFEAVETGRIGALREAVRDGVAALREDPALGGSANATSALPTALDRVERSLLVSRSTLLIIALQLVLLAGCTLFLVARLLSAERAGETRVLRARGGSRAQVARLAALEALLLAVPAAACAPLLAGPLTGLLAGWGALARIGLHLETSVGSVAGRGSVWLVAAGVAVGCALAVTVPALTSSFTAGRARPLPGVVRAGADVGLLAVAAVAYWQLSRQPSGVVGAHLGVDPLLVTAPALALLAGTVLTLRLLPPLARLAERGAARGRGLPGALAGWQFSRRPMRGAGPVLLLVLAVALGMLAIGQGSSWQRSQDDQADFRAGAPVRLLGAGESEPGRTQAYAAVPGVETAAPAYRTSVPLSGNRTATVLALDTERAADTVLMRSDLAPEPVRPLLDGLAPKGGTAGVRIPEGTARLTLTARIRGAGPGTTADVRTTLTDPYGTPYKLGLGRLRADGRTHPLTLDLAAATEAPPGELTLTGLQLDLVQPVGETENHRLTLAGLTATDTEGRARRLALPTDWALSSQLTAGESAPDASTGPTRPRLTATDPPTFAYGTGHVPGDGFWNPPLLTVRLQIPQQGVAEISAIATDRYLASTSARPGQRVDVTIDGSTVPVRIVRAVRALPSAPTGGSGDGGALLLDLPAVNRVLQSSNGENVLPTEWWLRTAPGASARVAAALRDRPDVEPSRVVVRDEIADRLRADPFGAGPEAAFTAAALAAAALTAVGFAVSAAGALRERSAEFAVLRALGASRRRLARVVVVEHGVLVALASAVGVLWGTVLARAVIPLIMLTSDAARPVPRVLVELPVGRVAVLLAAVAVTPLLVTAVLAVRRVDPVTSLRERGGD
ncbi:peptide ABC transporter permease [Streptomyces sp. NWU339]|uniref:FtsX-like permease family protein n=1 Tax=Streptomyces sp. NWU339 TaxID=2185284 RepID=UPI000D68227C|nr:FtsX-like permease family protein [Streptomyces sp. NWU339]PWI09651.1 peptide ABC transporter permease [Streptomyces sp. NWU339]